MDSRIRTLGENLYEFLGDEEDARLCDDIDESACRESPLSFLLILVSNFMTKLGDELSSPKTTLAWASSVVGAPAFVLGYLVPIRESGSMVPQLFIGARVRQLAVRKWAWVAGSLVQFLCVTGLGLTVLLLLTIVRTDLLDGWRETLGEEAPNHFMINIQPQERESVANIFADAGIESPEFVPLVRARMSQVNGESAKDYETPVADGEWFISREANLTFAATLSSSNELVAGEWWAEDYAGPPLASIEEEISMETGLGLGDRGASLLPVAPGLDHGLELGVFLRQVAKPVLVGEGSRIGQ